MRLYLLPLTMALISAAELQRGDALPELKGEFLTGKEAILPVVTCGPASPAAR